MCDTKYVSLTLFLLPIASQESLECFDFPDILNIGDFRAKIARRDATHFQPSSRSRNGRSPNFGGVSDPHTLIEDPEDCGGVESLAAIPWLGM